MRSIAYALREMNEWYNFSPSCLNGSPAMNSLSSPSKSCFFVERGERV